jgi:hypothetical protein
MTEQEALLDKFSAEIESAVRYAVKRCHLDPADLRQYAVERLIGYSVTGEGWTAAGGDRLRIIDAEETDRKGKTYSIASLVQQTLNRDLLNFIAQDYRQRGEALPEAFAPGYAVPPKVPQNRTAARSEGTVTLEQHRAGMRPAEFSGSLDDLDFADQAPGTYDQMVEGQSELRYEAVSPSAEDVVLADEAGDSTREYLDAHFPLLMAQSNGQTETEIAEDFGLTHQQVNYRTGKERGEFLAWVRENPEDKIVQALMRKLRP